MSESESANICAPITGRVKTLKNVGDRVKKGDPVAMVETEGESIPVSSPLDAFVSAVVVADGSSVGEGYGS